jgi:putative membrane protein
MWPFIIGFTYSFAICLASYVLNAHFSIPWEPIGIIGISVAFYLGFKNNSAYDRTWEARKIWGSIVNNSRTFAAATVSFVQGNTASNIHKELIYRHIAWLTALRHQLRLQRSWEHINERLNAIYNPTICEDYNNKLESELMKYITKEEADKALSKANAASYLLKIQSQRLQELKDQGYFEDFRHMEFHAFITAFYEDQGKSERIKNFPFPRQYASTALWVAVVFCAIVPLGLLDVFRSISNWMFWLHPFISGMVIWIFMLMEKIGDYSENPFEGTYNDVPLTAISRGIEIDIRQMLENENDIPKPIEAENGFLM